jgi:hypothetical protein
MTIAAQEKTSREVLAYPLSLMKKMLAASTKTAITINKDEKNIICLIMKSMRRNSIGMSSGIGSILLNSA